MDNSTKCGTQLLCKTRLSELKNTILLIGSSTSLKADHHGKLIWLSKELIAVNEVKSAFTVPAEESQMLSFLGGLAAEKKAFYQLIETANLVEPSLSYLLDLIELQLMEPSKVYDFDDFFDIIESCTSLAAEIKIWMSSKVPLLEASLEFYEISYDHIDTLEMVIDKSIDLCFEVQEDRFASPVRHPPSFTLKQVVRLLTSHADDTEVKIPTFSPLEETLCNKYLELRRSITPIEKSLKDVLLARIEQFSRRNIIHIDYLTNVLKKKYEKVLIRYKLMIKEVNELKRELVDKRWNTLFLNLNHELTSILDEIDNLQAKLLEYNYNSEMQEKIKEQINIKSKTITKTFSVIYRALEFSLLNADVASKTNELAQRWLDTRSQSDRLLSTSSSSVCDSSVDSLSLRLRSLSMGSSETSENEPSIARIPSRGNFGALLLKKMNIKPVMVTSPTSNESNPFFHSNPRNEEGRYIKQLLLNPVPALPFERRESPTAAEHRFDILTPAKCFPSIEEREAQKINYYSGEPTCIPRLRSRTLSATGWRTRRFDSPRTPSPQNIPHVRQPTSLSDILKMKKVEKSL